MVQYISDKKQKEKIALDVLHSPPNWFPSPAIDQIMGKEQKDLPFWGYEEKGNYLGFLFWKGKVKHTAEIYVIGLLPDYQRKRIGTALFQEICIYAKEQEYKFLQVQTIDNGWYEIYNHAQFFYEKTGHCKLEVFPTLWDEMNPCLMMVIDLK